MKNITKEFDAAFHGGRKLFILTWPQTTGKMDYTEVFHFFSLSCKNVAVGLEHHADGGEHIHAAAHFEKAISLPKLLKLCQKTWPTHLNVNIQQAKCFHCCWNYCIKDGCFHIKGEAPLTCQLKTGAPKVRSLKQVKKYLSSLSEIEHEMIMDRNRSYLDTLC